jgi:AraC-like DNA-binding protein
MTRGAKDMIAGCIDTMRAHGCGDCPRRERCGSLLRLFGTEPPARRRAPPGPAANPFLSLLGLVARTVETWAKEQADVVAASGTSVPEVALVPEPGAFCRLVEARIEPLLAAGPVRVGTVAHALGLSRQTLYRRLKAEGTTFEQLLDRLRRRLALHLVRAEGVPVKDAAYRLGFSDPAAFSRAFKRWTGASPRSQRARDTAAAR